MTSVTFVSSPMDGSCGIGTYTQSLISGLDDEIEINVVTLETHKRGFNAIPSYIRAAIRSGNTDDDIIHVQHEYGLFGTKWYLLWVFYPLLFLFSRINGTQVVLTSHGAMNKKYVDPPLELIKRLYIWMANKLIAATATKIIFLSKNCEQKFSASVSVENTCRITHGVYNDKVNIPNEDAKEKMGFDPDDIVITEPGYVRPSKGHETFLEIAKKMPEYEFLIAGGSGDAEEYYESIIESAPKNVTITGQLDDEMFHTAFCASDVVVLPYNKVHQSGVFNMCATYGVPTITRRLPYFESLEATYDCVETFDNEDESEELIKMLVNDKTIEKQLSTGLQEFKQQNSFETICQKHLEIYNCRHN